jgi:hypothetical protein
MGAVLEERENEILLLETDEKGRASCLLLETVSVMAS